MKSDRTFRVALLQLENRVGQNNHTFQQAEAMIERHIKEPYDFVFLPELAPAGYAANTDVWNHKEPMDGPSMQWARAIAMKYGIHLGFGFIEHHKKHVFNSYAIVDSRGILCGVVRKQFSEYYVFRSFKGPKYIDTTLARVGIAICADSHQIKVFKEISKHQVDFVVLPYAWPVASTINAMITKKDVDNAMDLLDTYPFVYSTHLKIPTLFVNAVGKMQPMVGLLGKLMTVDAFSFKGHSKIISFDNHVVAEAAGDEEIISGTITVNHPLKTVSQPKVYSKGWLHQGSFMLRCILMPVDGLLGRIYYFFSGKRRNQ